MHQPVLLKVFLEFAQKKNHKSLTFWDATLGAGGHSMAWLKCHTKAHAFASDCDDQMLEIAQQNFAQEHLEDQVTFKHANFVENPFEHVDLFDIIFMDLGISSYHLDSFKRGISYKEENSLLDLRIDTKVGTPCFKWLNKASLDEITQVLFEFGEESKAKQIAYLINKTRQQQEILYTKQITDICKRVYSVKNKYKYTFKHPYVKTLQAFRIHTNKELENLNKALNFIPHLLKKEGRLIIISFHSLEDRIIKQKFKSLDKILDTSPYAKSNYKEGDFKIITKKPIIPSADEIQTNYRCRSAKMRILERVHLCT